jgi:hypothetical protein
MVAMIETKHVFVSVKALNGLLETHLNDGWLLAFCSFLSANPDQAKKEAQLFCIFTRDDSIMPPLTGGVPPMRLVPFADGSDTIYINPDDVSAVEQLNATKTRIHLKTGKSFSVDKAHALVAVALAEDVT